MWSVIYYPKILANTSRLPKYLPNIRMICLLDELRCLSPCTEPSWPEMELFLMDPLREMAIEM